MRDIPQDPSLTRLLTRLPMLSLGALLLTGCVSRSQVILWLLDCAWCQSALNREFTPVRVEPLPPGDRHEHTDQPGHAPGHAEPRADVGQP